MRCLGKAAGVQKRLTKTCPREKIASSGAGCPSPAGMTITLVPPSTAAADSPPAGTSACAAALLTPPAASMAALAAASDTAGSSLVSAAARAAAIALVASSMENVLPAGAPPAAPGAPAAPPSAEALPLGSSRCSHSRAPSAVAHARRFVPPPAREMRRVAYPHIANRVFYTHGGLHRVFPIR